MSLFKSMALVCPSCETSSEFDAAGSVNADRRPDLRDAILDNSFQVMPCPACSAPMRLEPEFNYLDVKLGLWVAAFPARQLGQYMTLEDENRALFDESYGAQAPEAARSVGADLAPRLTFGWPAAREKLYLRQVDLDDVNIEMLKLDLIRRLPDAPLEPGVELRVANADVEVIDFVWIRTASEEVIGDFGARTAMLQSIRDNADAWAEVRATLTNGMFVDMQKMYIGEGRSAA